jgi:hypothetical protein
MRAVWPPQNTYCIHWTLTGSLPGPKGMAWSCATLRYSWGTGSHYLTCCTTKQTFQRKVLLGNYILVNTSNELLHLFAKLLYLTFEIGETTPSYWTFYIGRPMVDFGSCFGQLSHLNSLREGEIMLSSGYCFVRIGRDSPWCHGSSGPSSLDPLRWPQPQETL